MDDLTRVDGIQAYWGREGLDDAILAALAAAGKNLDSLTVEDLAPADQFHGGGKAATDSAAVFLSTAAPAQIASLTARLASYLISAAEDPTASVPQLLAAHRAAEPRGPGPPDGASAIGT